MKRKKKRMKGRKKNFTKLAQCACNNRRSYATTNTEIKRPDLWRRKPAENDMNKQKRSHFHVCDFHFIFLSSSFLVHERKRGTILFFFLFFFIFLTSVEPCARTWLLATTRFITWKKIEETIAEKIDKIPIIAPKYVRDKTIVENP
jgi:hypothetical protein